ncbi:MAG: precorrin-6A reductase [Butyrivibrio sp.]|uniref:precorrin-6A reductase n=1 Tax=Butyrivibrio sp. TaxID=28121 RepID=UPI001B129718|nr:precorrin-6A reductase [Butyrivibrio sp.]MBO6239630.1 precorrin-6A reductase [Butyrivibrio sp.]
MRKIVIFSGTTEGRLLSEMLSKQGISHFVCVATEYGKDMMDKSPLAKVLSRRMDKEAMEDFFYSEKIDDGAVVVDATHPYAREVTDNLKYVTSKHNIEYVRIIREKSDAYYEGVTYYSDASECAEALLAQEGNILLTTGSKELDKFSILLKKDDRTRVFVRVLPALESIKLCINMGVMQDHIIAMQGPFSQKMNEALLQQYDIKHLITKDSGTAGGFDEKIRAALSGNAKVHVIERPAYENGISVGEAFKLITGKEADEHGTMKVVLAGAGMGNKLFETVALKEEIEKSDIVFGAERLLKEISKPKYNMYLSSDIIPVLEKEKPEKAVILFSGDTGFYSGAKKMEKALRDWKKDLDITVLPGISSFSYLASKTGESYEDAKMCSLHGKNKKEDMAEVIDKIQHNRKTFVLLSGKEDVKKLSEKMLSMGIDAEITIGRNLSYEGEVIKKLTLEEAGKYSDEGIVTVFIKNNSPKRRLLINIKKDDFFIRDKVPMTKECIRHESIIRLKLKEGDIFYDIGGGTGSVAVEAAGLSRTLKVTTIEKKPEAVKLIKENVQKAGLENIDIICDEAIETVKTLPKPDAVFIGGSGGKLKEIIDILREKGPGIRFVINAVSLETIEEITCILKDTPHKDEEITMISVSDVKKAGEHHLLSAQNPVWIFSFVME